MSTAPRTPEKINYSFDKITNLIKEKEGLARRLDNLKGKTFSDVVSFSDTGERLQWVNFVQQGGGTLGISLVGYAAVLEYVGIRFLRLAGTSAGAVNTLFLAAIGEKEAPKTPELYDMVTDNHRFNMKSFVDNRYSVVRQIIYAAGRNSDLLRNIFLSFLVLFLLVLIPLPFTGFIGPEGRALYFTFLVGLLVAFAAIVLFLNTFGRLNYGINSGKAFYDFLDKELRKFGVSSQNDLDKKAIRNFNNINADESQLKEIQKQLKQNNPHFKSFRHQRKGRAKGNLFLNIEHRKEIAREPDAVSENLAVLKKRTKAVKSRGTLPSEILSDYSFVTTDIQNECKIVLPLDACHYFTDPGQQNPAQYIRASMAIPFFFEPYIFPFEGQAGQPCPYCRQKRKQTIIHTKVSQSGRLIDGGSLSNFPINLFHQGHIKEPRIPIMGVRIVDEEPVRTNLVDQKTSFGGYVGMMINTIRNNEDNSFLTINPFYQNYCIAHIKTYETNISWLNFDLTPKQKEELFLKGAEAAVEFLEKFNWPEYKKAREKL